MILQYKKGSLILLSGIPGSGKSTFCKTHFIDKNDYIISSDEIRQRYFGIKNVFQDDGNLGESLYQGTGKEVFEIMENIARKRCELGLTTIIDSTNLGDKQRRNFTTLGKWSEIYTIIFDENVGIENNKNRKLKNSFGYVNQDIIDTMVQNFEKRTSIKNNHIIKANEIESVEEIFDEIIIKDEKNVLIWGDIHGVKDFHNIYNNLQERYTKNGEKPFNIFVGDIVDRGEYSIENLLFIMLEFYRGNASMVLGNHENKLLENLIIYKETGEIKENIISRFTTLKRFAEYFSGKNNFLHIPELNERKFHIDMIIEFLKGLNYYKLLNFNQSKYLITHAPVLFEKNLGSLIKQDCVYSAYQFGQYNANSQEKSINDKINFLKAFNDLYKKTNTKLICGHFDLAKLQESENIGEGLISLEGEVDDGGYLKVCVLENINSNTNEEILSFPSNLKYIRDEQIGEFYKRVKNLSTKYYTKRDLGPLSVYKYSKQVFYDNLWHKNDPLTNELLLKLRGMVFDVVGNIVSYPFDKIFNLGETLKDDNNNIINDNRVPEEKPYQFIEKLNGFLGVISPNPYKNDLLIHTGGGFGGDHVEYIKKLISPQQYNKLITFFETHKYTLCFEVICSEDPHIIKYDETEYGLYLIGARNIRANNIEKMNVLSEEDLDKIGIELGFKRPKYFTSTLKEVKNKLNKLTIEGYILRDTETGEHIIKIKSPYYLITKFLSRLGDARFELLFKDKMQFIKIKNVEEEYYPLLDYIIENKDSFMEKDNLEKADFIREYLSR